MLNLFSRRRKGGSAKENFSFVAVGYPKVGNTWLRVTLGRYVQRLANLPDLPLFEPGDSTRLTNAIGVAGFGYFTHAPLEWASQTAAELNYCNVVVPFKGKKVVLLVRHPLDALVSFYMQNVHRVEPKPFSGDLVQFVRDPVFGLDKLIRFYELWFESLESEGIFLWRYEDAHASMVSSLTEVLEFLGLPIVNELIADAATYGSFDSMKAMEKAPTPLRYRSSGFNIFASGDMSNPDAFHVRKGVVGGYRGELAPDDADRFESVIRARMPSAYGYSASP